MGSSVLWAEATTVTSNGSVNGMHDSMKPLTGLVWMFNIAVGEVIFGGVGVGMIGMLMYAILALFLAGLMIGRTPEFLGKKLESREMIMAVIVVVAPAIACLIFAGIAAVTPAGLASLNNGGPPRPLGDTVRLLLGRGQQRLRLRRPQRKYGLLQPDHGLLHARGTVRSPSCPPWPSPAPSRHKEAHPREHGHLPHGGSAFRGDARGCRGYRRRPDVLSRTCAGARSRSSPARRGRTF